MDVSLFLDDDGSMDIQTINISAQGKPSKRINPDDLLAGDVIGEGSFGIVYRGIYKNTYNVVIKKVSFKTNLIFKCIIGSFFNSLNRLMSFPSMTSTVKRTS